MTEKEVRSINLTQAQAEWLDAQSKSNSKVVRDLIESERVGNTTVEDELQKAKKSIETALNNHDAEAEREAKQEKEHETLLSKIDIAESEMELGWANEKEKEYIDVQAYVDTIGELAEHTTKDKEQLKQDHQMQAKFEEGVKKQALITEENLKEADIVGTYEAMKEEN